jgi:hypothetical protein
MIHEDFAIHEDNSHEISDDAITSKILLLILGYKEMESLHPSWGNQSEELAVKFISPES